MHSTLPRASLGLLLGATAWRGWTTMLLTAMVLWLFNNTAYAQRSATATAQIMNGFVIGATITDGGAGYEIPPVVGFVGGGGSGARAYAVLVNGEVLHIAFTNAGFGYTSPPAVLIDVPRPVLGIPQMLATQRSATATAEIMNGFVIEATITDGGAGYEIPPRVDLVGGEGSGARAYAIVSDGAVIHIAVTNAGFGYTSPPTVLIAPSPNWQKNALMTLRGITGAPCQIQYVTNLAQTNGWAPLTNVTLLSNPWLFTDYESPQSARRYYRAVGFYTNQPPKTNYPAAMVFIPAGTFTMGSPTSEADRFSDEDQHTVTISQGFWIGKYEVTQAEYQSVMGSNPSNFKGDMRRPVEKVSWHDATNYCGKLTAYERIAGKLPSGYVYRLPTEAEWEYACRAGTTTRFSYGDDSDYTQLGEYAWYVSDGSPTHLVGAKKPNASGLYDMYGNVWEWCLDWYGPYPGGSVTDPKGPASGSYRVFRGGGWPYDGRYCRTAHRAGNWPDYVDADIGFRPVLATGH